MTTGDFSQYLVPNFHNLLLEMAKKTELAVWNESGHIQEILQALSIQPDFILINEFGETNSPRITGLDTLTIPYGILLYDLHYNTDARREEARRIGAQHIFTIYRDKFYEWYPGCGTHVYWLPHHVDINVFKDYGILKDINWLLMGSIHERLYPLRAKVYQTMQDKPGFVYHEHPGWRSFSEKERSEFYVGERYAREINRARMFLTCGSIYDYPLLKYYEIPACNTLMLASAFPELDDLGFIDGVHFVSIDEQDFEDKAEYYRAHEKERLLIARQGYEMVRANHSTALRASQLIHMIEKIISPDPTPFRVARKTKYV